MSEHDRQKFDDLCRKLDKISAELVCLRRSMERMETALTKKMDGGTERILRALDALARKLWGARAGLDEHDLDRPFSAKRTDLRH